MVTWEPRVQELEEEGQIEVRKTRGTLNVFCSLLVLRCGEGVARAQTRLVFAWLCWLVLFKFSLTRNLQFTDMPAKTCYIRPCVLLDVPEMVTQTNNLLPCKNSRPPRRSWSLAAHLGH